ncbi:MAG: DMT family transporter [Dokdonella sp.]|jgi:drug/metabolite transporter (DMT)-like permease|nr:DMT family transporter [Dokdonella sp.]MBK8124496.1 DMT family transporter [Dokdonella sp.]HPW04807.1 DMT family transporter [Dokdonella sp.]HQV50422.1 DMT family transporter [Dokdonella sp.]
MPLASLIRLVLLGMIWGASFLFQRITVPAVGVAFTASIRIVLSALMLVLIARVLGLSLQWRTHWRVWLFLGTVNTAIPFLCFAAAARSLPAGYMAVINATVPLLTVILAWAMFRIRPSASKRAGVVVGLLGVAVLARYGSIAMTAPVLLGIGLLFAAAAMYAYIALYVRQYPLGVDPLVMAAASQLGAAFVILPLGIHSLPTELPSLQVLACLLVLGIVCTGVAYLLYFRLLSDVGSEKAVTNTFLVPLFAQLWGALFLDEHLTAFGAIGFALVLLAVALVLEIRPWRKAQA